MKAIQIRYMSCTNHKPSRWKVWSEGVKAMVTSFHDDKWNCVNPQIDLAEEYIMQNGWNVEVSGIGVLPNGDWVATLKERKHV